MREVICLHIGQAGIQSGQSFWEQMCAEHAVAPDGFYNPNCSPEINLDSIFESTARGTLSPRAFCIDTDPVSLDLIRIGAFRDFYNPYHLISGPEDAGGCFARGYIHYGRKFAVDARDRIRRVLEACDKFQGFIVFRGMTGGTGSGLASSILGKITDDSLKRTVLSLDILPSGCPGEPIDPYNVVFALQRGSQATNVSFLLENEALFNIAKTQMDCKQPSFRHINQLIATVASHITTGLRYKSDLNMTLSEFQTNLVPVPRLKYPVLAYAPACAPSRGMSNMAISTMVNSLFSPQCQMVKCNTAKGEYFSAVLLLRGDFQPTEVSQHVYRLANEGPKSSIRFVDWVPAGMKYSLCTFPPMRPVQSDLGYVPRAAVGALNSTAMKDVLSRYISRFKKLYKKKAFVHHFLQEGMDEGWFETAKDDMLSLQSDFDDIKSGKISQPPAKTKPDMTIYGKKIVQSSLLQSKPQKAPLPPPSKPKAPAPKK